MARLKFHILQVLIALDQLGTALVGGFADECLSSYSYRLEKEGKLGGRIFRPAIDWIALAIFRQPNHCYLSYLSERARAQMPPELR